MSTEPTAEDPDEMPAEFGFSHAVRNRHYVPPGTEVTTRVWNADGSFEERIRVVPPRPDFVPTCPDSLIGAVNEEFFYVYNPDRDVLSFRLESSLSECVTARDGEPGYQLMVAESTGEQVGLIVRDYRRRFDAAHLGEPASRESIELAVAQLADQLPRAA